MDRIVAARRKSVGALTLLVTMAAALAITFSACSRDRSATADGEVLGNWKPQGSGVANLPVADIRSSAEKVLAGAPPAPLDKDQWKHVRSLYKTFPQGPLWFTKDGLDKPRAGALMKALAAADSDAMGIDDYPLPALAQALEAVQGNRQPTADQVAQADVLLSSLYVALGEDLLTGQVDPRSVSQAWHINPEDEHVDSALVNSLRAEPLDKAFARMRPQGEDYDGLRKSLAEYKAAALKGGWPQVPKGKALKPGDTDSPQRLAALRARLQAEGITGADTTSAITPVRTASANAGGAAQPRRGGANVYDASLAAAVKEFQSLHGIPADGMLGEETVNSMNTPLGYRVGQIAANLERQRWLPRSLGRRYIYVNVPAFMLTAYDSGQKSLEMKVIVGQEYEDKATPVFSDSMETVVFRPYWLVTPDIQAKELGPKIAADPGYMAAHNYEYYRDGGATRIRQRPGGENSLGLVKFLFPNDFNIYLHDTPQDNLFKKDVRAFSHGCIRLEKPAELAQWVLGWDAGKVQEAMNSGPDNKSVRLPKKLPVYIVYATAYMKDGHLAFGNDLYRRDDDLVAKMQSWATPKPQSIEAFKQVAKLVAD